MTFVCSRTLGRLGGVPLHAVLRGNLTKVGLDNGSSLGVAESALVSAGTEVLLALGLEELVQAVRGLGRAGLVAGRNRGLGRSSGSLNSAGSGGGHDGSRRAGTGDTLGVVGVGLGAVVAGNTGGRSREALATALSVGISSLDVSRASRGQGCRKDNGRESSGRDIHLVVVCVGWKKKKGLSE